MDSTYSVEELAVKARAVFEKPPEVVTAALKGQGKESFTVDEAKRFVKKFLEKEVK